MPFTDIWDVTTPPDTQLASLLGQDIRNLKLDIQQRMSVISGLSTMMPSLGTDAQPANWTGLLFFATDNGHIYQWSGSAWTDVTLLFLKQPIQSFATEAAPGATIPANTLVFGTEIDCFFQIEQPDGSVGCTFTFGNLTTGYVLFGNNISGTLREWYITMKLMATGTGAAGFVGGYMISSYFGSVPQLTSLQDSAVNFTVPNVVGVNLGFGCVGGPMRTVVTV